MPLDRPALRKLLNDILRSDSDLDAFCLDHFRDEVHARFTNGQDRVAKTNILLTQIDPERIAKALRYDHAAAVDAVEHASARVAPTAAAAPPPVAPPPPAASSVSSDPAFEELRQIYHQERLIVFVGAGISAAAGLPSWKRLVEILAAHPRVLAASEAERNEIKDFAARFHYIDALSAIKQIIGPGDFYTIVEKELDDEGHPVPPAAEAIAALAPKLRAVLTTNIDHLLERAFAGNFRPVYEATADLGQRRRYILKLHGTLLKRTSWVFTRDEYEKAMYANPVHAGIFSSIFHTYTLLFVGYGLMDDDFDAVLGRVRALAGPHAPRHFAFCAEGSVPPFRKRTLEDAGVRPIEYKNADGKHGELVRLLEGLR